MKNSITILIIGFVCATAHNLYAQCNADALTNTVVSEMPSGYNFLKSYKIDGEADLEKIEFSYVLTKGTSYTLVMKDTNAPFGTVVTLYDTKRNKVACNKIGKEVVPAVAFNCNATGIYYIQYTFAVGASRCGSSALGFKR